MEIDRIVARQILDSRGNPTIEADVWLANGVFGRAAVPSGASTGSHEAHELRDGGEAYGGLGVKKAIASIHDSIVPAIRGMRVDDQFAVDARMIELDGTANKSRLGANAILAVSLGIAQAAAKARGIILYVHINDIAGKPKMMLPMPMMNILNGGRHAAGSTDIQESMVVPIGASSYEEAIKTGNGVFLTLKKDLQKAGYATTVGDEGGFAPALKGGNQEALQLITRAITDAGYTPGKDAAIALDVAASELFSNDTYTFASENKTLTPTQLISWYQDLCKTYPIVSLEDGLNEDDWSGWSELTKTMGGSLQLVGDDLLVTNITRLKKALDCKAANAILIKPNQIGTLTETINVIAHAKAHGWGTIVSHRSGETEDVTIAHLAVGTGAGQIKTGSLSRSERTAKHNELLRLESIDPTLSFYNPFRA